MIELEVSTHSGDKDIVEVREYNSEDLAERLNDNDIQAVSLGDNVYSRIDIKNVRKIEGEYSEQE